MEIPPLCYVCGAGATLHNLGPFNPEQSILVECPRCGKYTIEFVLTQDVGGRIDNHILSGILRNASDSAQPIRLRRENIDEFIKNAIYPHDTLAKIDELLLLANRRTVSAEKPIIFHPESDCSLVFCRTPDEFNFLIGKLKELDYAERYEISGPPQMRLGYRGWQRVRELQKKRPGDSKDAFMAMPFGDPELDEIYHHNLQPAIKKAGFDLKRVDEKQPAGLIDDQLRVRIQNSRFVLAELTTHDGKDNGGVYWEAGYAEGLGKPVIYLCKKKSGDDITTHFDTNHHVTVFWNNDNLAQAMDRLKAAVRFTFPADAKMTDDEIGR